MKKRYIALSVLLIIIGLTLCIVPICLSGFRFLDMFDGNSVQKTYEIVGDIASINIKDLDSDVVIRKSHDGVSKIVYYDNNRYTTVISEENGALTISSDYDGKWYNYIGVMSSDKDAVIYLAKDVYDSLYVDSDTCDIKNAEGVSFNTVNIALSTGDVELGNMKAGELSISVSTGDIDLDRIECSSLNVSATTGDLELDSVKAAEISLSTSTGDINLEDVVSDGLLNIKTTTGDVELEGCDGSEIRIKTSSGDVEGYFLSGKKYQVYTSTGRVRVPEDAGNESCEIRTSTGDVIIAMGDRD